jgi:hypothetical protein
MMLTDNTTESPAYTMVDTFCTGWVAGTE